MRRPPLALLIGVLLLVGILAACGEPPAPATKYHCPMHPTYVSDRPGDCPICGMKLVPIQEAAPAPSGAPASSTPEPGRAGNGADAVDGLVPVSPGAEGLALAGVQTVAATRARFQRTIRTVGEVKPDETRIHHIHTKVPGWIEHLHANFKGQLVKKGEPVLDIYSPELLATQEEYLAARDASARFAGSSLPEVRRGGEDLLRSARRKLELLDVPPGFVKELERRGTAARLVTLNSPASGFVTAKEIWHGMQVEPGMELYTITDLAQVWIEGAFYESEARSVTVGQPVHVTLPHDPGVVLAGHIDYVYPFLEPESRTLRVRLTVDNPTLTLKPAMYANLEVALESGEGIVIPDDALIDTGARRVVFVAGADGRFFPREVTVGERSGGKAQVLAGLQEGERVVTHANFLLDSESRLRAAIGSMNEAKDGAGPAPGGAAGTPPTHVHGGQP